MSVSIILASSSAYRKNLLQSILPNFECHSPDIDESAIAGESIEDLVTRLSITKAQVVAQQHSNALVIGSDQAGIFNGEFIGKPNSHEAAVEHLMAVSGKSITLHTGIALINSQTNTVQSAVVPTTVTFRQLNRTLVNNYLKKDTPYNCAGSVKVESLGIVLIERIESSDPNALIGLPLIQLVSMLNNENYNVLVDSR